MQFSVVGNLAEAGFLVERIHQSADHTLGPCCIADGLLQKLQQSEVPLTVAATAEDAIAAIRGGVLIVAESRVEDSVQMIRRATQEECPVLAFAPLDVSTAWSYEVHLLLDESSAGVVPLTGRWFADPELRQLEQADLQQLNLSLSATADPLMQRRRQMQAIDLMVGTGLRFSQVTGLDLNGPDGQLLTRSVTLGSAATDSVPVPPALIRFESEPPATTQLVVNRIDGSRQAIAVRPPLASTDPATDDGRLIDAVTAAVSDPARCQIEMERLSNTLELLEGLDKSFRRRRTVDVYLDSVSERAVFKTQMTAIGCGVLGYLMFGLVGYLMMAQLLQPSPAVLNVARLLWIAPLILFLAAQLLLPLARDRTPAPAATQKDHHDPV